MSNAPAWYALGVSVLSFGLGAASLAWQAATFRLTGSVAKAELRTALFGGGRAILAPATMDGLRAVAAQVGGHGYTEPHLAVIVRNTGRTGVSVDSVSAKNGLGMTFQETSSGVNPKHGTRLDPGHSETYYLRLQPLIAAALVAKKVGMKNHQKALIVWGIATLGDGKTVETPERLKLPAEPDSSAG